MDYRSLKKTNLDDVNQWHSYANSKGKTVFEPNL